MGKQISMKDEKVRILKEKYDTQPVVSPVASKYRTPPKLYDNSVKMRTERTTWTIYCLFDDTVSRAVSLYGLKTVRSNNNNNNNNNKKNNNFPPLALPSD
jgi:hypothetical protein